MNIFGTFWYGGLIALVYLAIENYNDIFDGFDISFLMKYYLLRLFWILPFYLVSEIVFTILITNERKNDRKFIPENEFEQKETLKNTHLIIPCHKVNENNIIKHVTQLKRLFDGNIWIADNDSKDEKNASFHERCEQINVNYLYYNQPNKTNAMYETVKYIKKNVPDAKNVILLDDDTELPNTFFLRKDLLEDDTVAGYCCNIQVEKNEQEYNYWENWIDFEYKTISYRNSSRNLHSLRFLHGIISVYKIDCMLEIFKWNPCNVNGLPFGEDAYAGIQARSIGYKLKQDHLNTVMTFSPNCLFNFTNKRNQGYGSTSLFKQRAMRWYLSWPRRILQELGLCLFYNVGTWYGNLLYRLDFVMYVFLLGVSVGWIYYLIYLIVFHQTLLPFLYLHLGFFGVTILMCYFRYFSMRPDEREKTHHKTLLTFPIFLLTLLYLYCSSFLLSVFYYIPMVRLDYKKCIAKK